MRQFAGVLRQFGLMLAVASSGIPVFAKTPEILQPTSPWNLNYADKKCTAARVFGTDKAAVTLVLEQYAPGDSFRVSLLGDQFKSWIDGTFKLRFGPTQPWQDVDYFPGDFGKGMYAVFARGSLRITPVSPDITRMQKQGTFIEAPPIPAGHYAAVETVDIAHSGRTIRIATGRLDKLFTALGTCTDSLVKSWGLDPQSMRTLKHGPAPLSPPPTWIRSGDYPTSAVFRGARALIMVRLNTDANGGVTACEIQQSTRDGDDFAKAVCGALTRRAKFKPAVDSAGKPVAAYWNSTVIFVL